MVVTSSACANTYPSAHMATTDPAVQFAQKLAGNEKKTRDRAVRKLRAYLRARDLRPEGGFTHDEFCKIWKGLFYCLWMQDKPLLQEYLSQTISQLIHALHSKQSQGLFLRTFWQTLNREWNGIDRLRMDKFYSLTRLMFRQSVELLKAKDWEESAVEEFLSLLVQEVLQGGTRGVQLHLIDIYLDEFAKVGAAELPADLNLKLIEPFSKIASKTKDTLLLQSILSGVFQSILDQAPFAIEELMKELDETSHGQVVPNGDCAGKPDAETSRSEEDVTKLHNDDIIGPVLQFDYQAIASKLLSLASRRSTPAHNRKRLYRFIKQFQDLAEGIFPQDEVPEEVSTDEDDDEFSSWRFRKRQKKAKLSGDPDAPYSVFEPLESEKEPQKLDTSNPSKKKRKKKRAKVNKGKQTPLMPALNGDAQTITHTEDSTSSEEPRVPMALSAQISTMSESNSQSMKLLLKRRKRGGLIRLCLSVLPLRTRGLMRRRMVLEQYRNKKLRATLTTQKNVTHSKTDSPKILNVRTTKGKPDQQNVTYVDPSPKLKTTVHPSFVTFCKTQNPKPVYVKNAKGRVGQIRSKTSCTSKKVTFSLNKNMTAEFKRSDRSLLVSPTGSSRVPFNPEQRPQHSVLKTPSPGSVSRSRAADFF
ncbi:ribosomal RNA processing protein 1 homolog A isoform X2 [Bombina bombina]|uniref:ribosomal RNA processing protein 1 homolog A isoform X2 n=1 Tax=Bombina bombina TaxID=8345 RepID=UPI00235ADBF6|nr:ribosomal RNA processing protein 1 homolog A isoform X2 [Bombina bombina]